MGELFPKRKFDTSRLSGKWIAVDAFNIMYQFLSIIRQPDGTPLMDSSGKVTSHLSGILYRIANLIETGCKIAFVFDGEPPKLKKETLFKRSEIREKATANWQEAIASGEDGFKYAQASARINSEILTDALRLLDAMGVPTVQAPCEGEAQAAYMALSGDVSYVASQDYDSLLFGAPNVIRNLTISGKRKVPRKNVYIDVEPEVINLQETLERLHISRDQLVDMAILCGTDFNKGLERVGAKTALKLIGEHGNIENVMKARGEVIEDYQEVKDLFLHPAVTDEYNLVMKRPNVDEICKFLCDERDFSADRVLKATERLKESYNAGQSTLDRWF